MLLIEKITSYMYTEHIPRYMMLVEPIFYLLACGIWILTKQCRVASPRIRTTIFLLICFFINNTFAN